MCLGVFDNSPYMFLLPIFPDLGVFSRFFLTFFLDLPRHPHPHHQCRRASWWIPSGLDDQGGVARGRQKGWVGWLVGWLVDWLVGWVRMVDRRCLIFYIFVFGEPFECPVVLGCRWFWIECGNPEKSWTIFVGLLIYMLIICGLACGLAMFLSRSCDCFLF